MPEYTSNELKEIFFSNETSEYPSQFVKNFHNFDEDLFNKIKGVFTFLMYEDINEDQFVRLASLSSGDIQRLFGADNISIDGVYTLFLSITRNKWNTAKVVTQYEIMGFPADYLCNILTLGELGRFSHAFIANHDNTKNTIREIALKVGKHLTYTALYLNEKQYMGDTAPSQAEVELILKGEINDFMADFNLGAYLKMFPNSFEHIFPLVRKNIKHIDEFFSATR